MARGRRLFGQLVLVLAVMAAAFVGARLGLLGTREVGASHNFTDVPDGAFFHDFVDFLVDTGITAGCGPLLYCPERAVTRGEQAVFLKKFLAVGSMPQVVDANGRLVGRTTTVTESWATVALSVQNRLVFVPVAAGPDSRTRPVPRALLPRSRRLQLARDSSSSTWTRSPRRARAKVRRPGTRSSSRIWPTRSNVQRSRRLTDGLGGVCNRLIPPFTGTGFPAISLVDLDTLGFQTPFGLL